MNPLASTVFSAGPKDTLATTDVYNVKNKNVINSIQVISAKLGVDLSGLLNFGKSDFTNILKVGAQGVGIDTDVLTARLLGTSSALSNSFRQMEKSSKSAILETFSDSGKLSLQIGSVVSECKSADFSDISSLGKFVNTYTNSTLYSPNDQDAVSSLLSGVIKQGAALGMNGLYSNLTAGITDNKLLSKITVKSLPALTKAGDLHSLSTIANGILGHSLDFIYPSFADDLAKAFGYKGLADALLPQADYHSLLTILSLTNPNWDVFTRENDYSGSEDYHVETGMSIVKLQQASPDFQKLIIEGIKTEVDGHRRKHYALVQFFRRTVMEDEIHRFFPRVAFPRTVTPLLKSQHKNKSVDPRVLINIGAKVISNLKIDL